jgi:hypothetical protein
MKSADCSPEDRLVLALFSSASCRLALNDWDAHGLAAGSSGLSVPAIVPAHQLLAALVDVLPAGAAADAEEMTDRDCHVATAVNGQVSGRPVFCDQRSDEPLITATDRDVHTDSKARRLGGCVLCVINDRDVPSFAEEVGHDQQR